MVAREIADAGLRVLLLDLTAAGAASRPMLDSASYPGITNLLASEAQFTDVIHTDHYSDCHVMPVGTADPVRAMGAADRLPIIMESLTTAYDVVIVECGPADAEAIRRLVTHETEILVSVIEPDEKVRAAAEALKAGGYAGHNAGHACRSPFAGLAVSGALRGLGHSLEFLQRGIDRVPRMAADAVGDHLRIELAWVVKAGRVDRYRVRHCGECQVDRRSAGRAEGVDLFVAAVARLPASFSLRR